MKTDEQKDAVERKQFRSTLARLKATHPGKDGKKKRREPGMVMYPISKRGERFIPRR